jgi:segregation and condensation protein B
MKSQETREKEKAEKIKALRRELEAELEEQFAAELWNERPKVEVQKVEAGDVSDPAYAKKVVEALLFASSKPLTAAEIRKVIGNFSPRDIDHWIQELKEAYASEGRSFEVFQIAGGWEIGTKKEFAPWILKIELQKKARQASQSALETLAILAYKQPITRAEIEELRGVDVSGVLSTLLARGFIKIVGKKEIPGRPFLYATTDKFLEHFGLKSLQDLPSIEEIKSMVESAVKKEELLGTQNIVEVPQESEGKEEALENSIEETREKNDGSYSVTQEN